MVGEDGAPEEYAIVYCKQRADGHDTNNGLCKCRTKYTLQRGVPHCHEAGTHKPQLSKSQVRKNKEAIKKEMAANPLSVSTQTNQRIDAGVIPADLPKDTAVYDARTALRRSAGARSVPSARIEWEELAIDRVPRPGDPEWRLIVDPAHSHKESLIIVFRCRFLISLAEEMIKKHGPDYKFRLCCDGTHDQGLQKFKLIGLSWLGVHFTRGQWKTTFVPLAFALAPQENNKAAGALVDSVIESMRHVGIELVEQTAAVYLDGGAALVSIFQDRFPLATRVRCLQHVKKYIKKETWRWRHHDYNKNVTDHTHHSAFLEPELFDRFWRRVFKDLEDQGEIDFVNQLRCRAFRRCR